MSDVLLGKWHRDERMSRKDRLDLAASRWRKQNPSADDVLMRQWPDYHHSVEHTAGYHRDFRAILELVSPTRKCVACGGPISTRQHDQARFCDRTCSDDYHGRAGRKTLTRDERRKMAARYRDGATLAELGRTFGRSESTISRYLEADGVARRKTGGARDNVQPVHCEQCGNICKRRTGEGPRKYALRRYCGRKCHDDARRKVANGHTHRPRGAEARGRDTGGHRRGRRSTDTRARPRDGDRTRRQGHQRAVRDDESKG